MKLGDFRALTFDCYGTLIDWESGMAAALQPPGARPRSPLSRDRCSGPMAGTSRRSRRTPAKRY